MFDPNTTIALDLTQFSTAPINKNIDFKEAEKDQKYDEGSEAEPIKLQIDLSSFAKKNRNNDLLISNVLNMAISNSSLKHESQQENVLESKHNKDNLETSNRISSEVFDNTINLKFSSENGLNQSNSQSLIKNNIDLKQTDSNHNNQHIHTNRFNTRQNLHYPPNKLMNNDNFDSLGTANQFENDMSPIVVQNQQNNKSIILIFD